MVKSNPFIFKLIPQKTAACHSSAIHDKLERNKITVRRVTSWHSSKSLDTCIKNICPSVCPFVRKISAIRNSCIQSIDWSETYTAYLRYIVIVHHGFSFSDRGVGWWGRGMSGITWIYRYVYLCISIQKRPIHSNKVSYRVIF